MEPSPSGPPWCGQWFSSAPEPPAAPRHARSSGRRRRRCGPGPRRGRPPPPPVPASRCCSPCNAPVAGQDQCASVPSDRRRVTARSRRDKDRRGPHPHPHRPARDRRAAAGRTAVRRERHHPAACRCRPASRRWPTPTSGSRAPSSWARADGTRSPARYAEVGGRGRHRAPVAGRRLPRPPGREGGRRPRHRPRPPGRADRGPGRSATRRSAPSRPRRCPCSGPSTSTSASAATRSTTASRPATRRSAEPYAYVGPWTPRTGEFWNQSFGAAQPMSALGGADAVADFFREGARLAAG